MTASPRGHRTGRAVGTEPRRCPRGRTLLRGRAPSRPQRPNHHTLAEVTVRAAHSAGRLYVESLDLGQAPDRLPPRHSSRAHVTEGDPVAELDATVEPSSRS
jgi:hypothetical protein